MISNLFINNAFLIVIAVGMTFVILTGGIDLSVGSVFALGGVLAAYASQYGALAALLVPLVVCGLIGLVQGLIIARGRRLPATVPGVGGAWLLNFPNGACPCTTRPSTKPCAAQACCCRWCC